MWDIILECFRTVVIALILFFIWKIGKERSLNSLKGWGFILYGWSFILFGSVLDITDNFESLNWLIVVGDTEVEAFLEKFVGLLIGYVLLFIGFLFWLPSGAKKIDNLKDEFVSTVSHELRTPLTSIYGAIKLIESGTLGEIPTEARKTLDVAARNSERLVLLINDILDIEKLESGKMEFDLEPQEILKLVNDAIEANSLYGEKYQVQYLLNQNSVSAMINIDANRFMQIMNNLLSNAAKFSPANSTVDITVTKQDMYVRVTVTDKGHGIKEEYRSLIFQKFSQSDSSNTRHSGGTGLGLAISKELVEGMGGEIGFTTAIGSGTSFYFNFPEQLP